VDPTDRYCNHNHIFFDATMLGLKGYQGPSYIGTGCAFHRAALYGTNPPRWWSDGGAKTQVDDPQRSFGNSVSFVSSMVLGNKSLLCLNPIS
jgi:mixed-linked glucan synthase